MAAATTSMTCGSHIVTITENRASCAAHMPIGTMIAAGAAGSKAKDFTPLMMSTDIAGTKIAIAGTRIGIAGRAIFSACWKATHRPPLVISGAAHGIISSSFAKRHGALAGIGAITAGIGGTKIGIGPAISGIGRTRRGIGTAIRGTRVMNPRRRLILLADQGAEQAVGRPVRMSLGQRRPDLTFLFQNRARFPS